MSQSDKIVNDSVSLNNLLLDITFIERCYLLKSDFTGEVVLEFEDGMIVHMTKKEEIKLNL